MPSYKLAEPTQWVVCSKDGGSHLRELLGGKGAELAEMTSLGMPVPPAFTITTEACQEYYRSDKKLPEGAWDQVQEALKGLEAATGRRFGDPSNPMLVSIRSGAVISMPGMMDTVLNLGINQKVADGITKRTGNERFSLDLYRRFIQMFSNVVLGVKMSRFDDIMEQQQEKIGVSRSADLTPKDLREIISRFKSLVKEATGTEVPEDPMMQLKQAVLGVFESWNTRRAIDYRDFHGISHDLGTAVNVMVMVYGNIDDRSCTGVCFTRDPATGNNKVYGEYLVNAQGEDVVSGVATPYDIDQLATEMPRVYEELVEVTRRLESHYRDVQDVEFTVEQGKLYILQTRTAKRSARSAVRIAVDMVKEGLISEEESLLRVEPDQINQLLLPRLDEKSKEQAKADNRLLATGLGASPGGATGKVVFDANVAKEMGRRGLAVILARPETSPDDVHGMLAAAGILTSRGGTTSHAAVVARGLGKPCVTGAEGIEVNPEEGYLRYNGTTVNEGEEISMDGSTGEVFQGSIASIQPRASSQKDMMELLTWADKVRKLGIWANADCPRDAETALELGAEGIGLCRTEHMFFEPERLALVREMILAAHVLGQRPDDSKIRQKYLRSLEQLEEFQTDDFENIFRVMKDRPVVIRLLDPPLHEFLPNRDELLEEVIELRVRGNDPASLSEKEELLAILDEMREANPMLGLRGCRLGLKYPEIYAMQARAIIAAASKVAREGVPVHPEIMVPLVGHGNEMRLVRERLEETIENYLKHTGRRIEYKIGTMIEIPRAALTADEIAETAEFFSFGTNDLTQTTFGYSRDDAEGKFLKSYKEEGIIAQDPFEVLDKKDVGQLIRLAASLGKRTRPNLTLGICGEHGGDPSSIEFCHAIGLDYVSCSPYRVPVARLAAARAALL